MKAIIRKHLTFAYHYFFIFLLLFFCKCSSEHKIPLRPNNKIESPKAVICPLEVGNFWTYIDSTIGYYGFQVDTIRLEITGKTNIFFENQLVEVFFWNWINKFTKKPEDWKWLNRNEYNGLYAYGILSSIDRYPIGKNNGHYVSH